MRGFGLACMVGNNGRGRAWESPCWPHLGARHPVRGCDLGYDWQPGPLPCSHPPSPHATHPDQPRAAHAPCARRLPPRASGMRPSRSATAADQRLPRAALSHFRFAECLHKKGDLSAALEQLGEAERLFREMRMVWWSEQAAAQRARMQGGRSFAWFVPYPEGPPSLQGWAPIQRAPHPACASGFGMTILRRAFAGARR